MPASDPPPAPATLPERDAQAALLVAAIEDADPEGAILSPAERARASERALAEAGAGASAAGLGLARASARRAHLLLEGPARTAWRAALRATRVGAGLSPYLVLLAFAVGLASNVLGPDRHLNVLSVPMLGVFAWNLAVYAVLAVEAVRRRRPGHDRAPRLPWLATALAGLRTIRPPRLASGASAGDGRAGSAGSRALAAYVRAWMPVSAGLLAARARRALHLGSAALAAGTVAGMYARGLAFEYRATWESTFLSAPAAQALLDAVLGPAAGLLGVAVPDVAPLRGASGDAAPWIHLWAVSAAIYVVVPRLALALVAAGRASRLASRVEVPLPPGRLARSLGLARAVPVAVSIVPYATGLGPRAVEGLKGLFYAALSSAAEVSLAPAREYGDEGDDPVGVAPRDGAVRARAVVFPLTQTPEPEVHGRFLEQARARLAPGEALLVLVDASAFRATAPPDRVGERRRVWDALVLASTGATPIHLDLERPADADVASRVAAAVQEAAA